MKRQRRHIRLPVDMATDPSMRSLHKKLGGEGCWSWMTLIAEIAKSDPSGKVPLPVERAEQLARWPGEQGQLVRTLVKVGLVDREEDGALRVAGWSDIAGHLAHEQTFRERASRAARARWNRRQNRKLAGHSTSIQHLSPDDAPSIFARPTNRHENGVQESDFIGKELPENTTIPTGVFLSENDPSNVDNNFQIGIAGNKDSFDSDTYKSNDCSFETGQKKISKKYPDFSKFKFELVEKQANLARIGAKNGTYQTHITIKSKKNSSYIFINDCFYTELFSARSRSITNTARVPIRAGGREELPVSGSPDQSTPATETPLVTATPERPAKPEDAPTAPPADQAVHRPISPGDVLTLYRETIGPLNNHQPAARAELPQINRVLTREMGSQIERIMAEHPRHRDSRQWQIWMLAFSTSDLLMGFSRPGANHPSGWAGSLKFVLGETQWRRFREGRYHRKNAPISTDLAPWTVDAIDEMERLKTELDRDYPDYAAWKQRHKRPKSGGQAGHRQSAENGASEP